jgi:1,4-dihydroxy-2-naphthoate octaprenyltransferase
MESSSLSNMSGADATGSHGETQNAPDAALPHWSQEAELFPTDPAFEPDPPPPMPAAEVPFPELWSGERVSRERALVKTDRRTGVPLTPAPPPGKIARWWLALRPETFSLSLLPVILGTALAWLDPVNGIRSASFHPISLVFFVLVVLLIHAGTNLLNECYDALRGITLPDGLGSSGMIQRRLLDTETVGGAGLALLAAGACGLLVLTLATRTWGVLIFGGISVLLAYFYSVTRYALSYFPLSELIIGFVMGPAILISAMQLQGAPVTKLAVTFSLALGGLAAAMVLANNLRDVDIDRAANKRTLVTYIGAQVGRALYLALVVLPYVLVVVAGFPHLAPHGVLLVLMTFAGLLVVISGVLRAETPAAMHVVVTRTLRLHTRFGLWLVAGYVLSVLALFILHAFF